MMIKQFQKKFTFLIDGASGVQIDDIEEKTI